MLKMWSPAKGEPLDLLTLHQGSVLLAGNGVLQMKAPLIKNETSYDGRTVASVVRFVFRELELNGAHVMVKVKMHRGFHAYQGRIYYNARGHYRHVWSESRGDYVEVAPKVPAGVDHLIVCRIGPADLYPVETHVYDRRDSPGTWFVDDWKEALVSITAHEAMHLRQYRKGTSRNEVQTEWAAYRLWKLWKARKSPRS